MLRIGKRLTTRMQRVLVRSIAGSNSRSSAGHMPVSSVLTCGQFVPTVDHNMSVERAAQLMSERHIDAISVTKDDRVIGLFTEHDYFDKVLNARHQATRSSMVSEVGIMGSNLVVARPDDTVEDCLAVMTKKNMMALPVVEHDGHAMGTVSLLDLTRQYMEETQTIAMDHKHRSPFSEPAMFPENLVLPDGGVHDEELGDPQLLAQLAMDPTDAMLDHSDHALEERAAAAFCESSVFPEYTPAEDLQLAEARDEVPLTEWREFDVEREDRFVAAHSEVLSRMERFSEPSDFPEAAPIDEVVTARG